MIEIKVERTLTNILTIIHQKDPRVNIVEDFYASNGS